jgi:hypothetical protein
VKSWEKPWDKIPHIQHSQWCGVSRLPISHILQRLPSARSHAALRPCGSVLDVSRDAEIGFTHHLWIIYIYCIWNYCMFFLSWTMLNLLSFEVLNLGSLNFRVCLTWKNPKELLQVSRF